VPTHSVPSSDGVTLALHDLGGDGPDLLLCHPTGFHALTWAPVAAALADVAHCWAVDFRGHGDSTRPESGSYDWHGMADDVLAVVDDLGLTGVRGVGHSMGGAALVLAEQARPGTMAGLWCYEPIVFPPMDGMPGGSGAGAAARIAAESPLAAGARRRKAWFPDVATARANYASKPPLNGFRADALDAYVEHGFRPAAGPDGVAGVELKCAPEVEASIFEMGGGHGGFARLGEVACPVTVVASGDGAPPAMAAGLVAEALPDGRLVTMPELTHFGPMEDPEAVAAAIAADLLD
jgi:pimeloyl-ACP methyl ester carboxylesterase